MQSTTIQQRTLLQNQIYRLAKISLSRPVTVKNMDWHNRVIALQVKTIKAKKDLK
jgi:hypothetical protein